jgi:two-component system, cell cycle sensor histidine kinase and response regulator CckA
LLVEDEVAVRLMGAACLRKYGYQVLEAENDQEALSVWARHGEPVDLLLTGLVMPGGMTGRELAGRLVQDKATLKVIYSSGYDADVSGEDLQAIDPAHFLPKPMNLVGWLKR